MAMYPQTILDEIKDKVSIAALISERVPLKKAGRNFKGNCPFHSEKTPSFMVSDEKQIYHCFGCGEGGNVFNFFMKFDNISFPEAVEMLAERSSVTLPKPEKSAAVSQKEDALTRKRKWAYRLNQIVTEYFHNNLKDPKVGADAANYLKSREIIPEKIAQHFLGYAEDRWDGLVSHLKEKQVPLDLATELGLIKKRNSGDGYYDFFRHRIVCPVITPGYAKGNQPGAGRVVAFSGRTFGKPKTSEGREDPAKYLNSPDSVVYHKSYTVFGLNVAIEAIRKTDLIVIVEGNLDVLRLHQEGILNVVAPLGTAVTSGHVSLLKRYTKNFVVIFDGDEAGKKAAFRSLPVFLEAGLIPKAVMMPEGEDPDSFVLKNGAEKFGKLIENAQVLFECVIDDTVERLGKGTDGKVKVVEELKPLFASVTNPVEVSEYRKRLALKLMLEESIIAASLSGRRMSGPKRGIADKYSRGNFVEKSILELMLTYPETVATVHNEIGVELFSDEANQTIARMIFEEFEKEGKLDVGRLVEEIDEPELKKEILSLALAEGKYENASEDIKDCIRGIKVAHKKRRLNELSGEIQKMKSGDERLETFMLEMQKITKELHNVT